MEKRMHRIELLRIGLQHCLGGSCRQCPLQAQNNCGQKLAQALDALLAEVAAMQWVPVTERVPHHDPMNDTRYLICTQTKTGRRSINLAWFDGSAWHGVGSHAAVTHWRPEPKLPGFVGDAGFELLQAAFTQRETVAEKETEAQA